jgi:hypothetical protein
MNIQFGTTNEHTIGTLMNINFRYLFTIEDSYNKIKHGKYNESS